MLFNYKEHRIFAFSDYHGMHKWLHIPEEADILLCAGDVSVWLWQGWYGGLLFLVVKPSCQTLYFCRWQS